MNETSYNPTVVANRLAPYLLFAYVVLLAVETVRLSLTGLSPAPRTFADFDAFYLAGRLVWRGEIEQAYDFAKLTRAQEAFFGAPRFLPWTYPPQFNLVVAPFALLPFGLAYGAFTGLTLLGYLLTLRRIAGDGFGFALAATFPASCVTILCGQNGFLTGALVGLICYALQNRRQAGLPLGFMIIKPHLAAAWFVFTVAARYWATVLVAVTTIALTSLLATVFLGTKVWPAFLGGIEEARGFLETDMYPVFRMISLYAALRSLGIPAATAFAMQAAAAVLVIGLIWTVAVRGVPLHRALGLTALSSLLMSPYAYDYDLPLLGIGLALLLPDFLSLASRSEQAALFALSFATGIAGLVQTFLRLKAPAESLVGTEDNMVVSGGGLTLVAIVALVLRVLGRDRKAA
jgi:hypothetical protein